MDAIEGREILTLEAKPERQPLVVRVTGATGGVVAGARVFVSPDWFSNEETIWFRTRAQTSSDGRAVFHRTAAHKTYKVTAWKDGAAASASRVEPQGRELVLVLETPRPLSFLVREKDGSVPARFTVGVRSLAPYGPKQTISREEGRVTIEPFSHGAYRIRIRAGKRRLELKVADIVESGVVVLPPKE